MQQATASEEAWQNTINRYYEFCMVLSSSEGMHETEEGGSFETLAATAAMLILVRRWGPWMLHIMSWKRIGLQNTGGSDFSLVLIL